MKFSIPSLVAAPSERQDFALENDLCIGRNTASMVLHFTSSTGSPRMAPAIPISLIPWPRHSSPQSSRWVQTDGGGERQGFALGVRLGKEEAQIARVLRSIPSVSLVRNMWRYIPALRPYLLHSVNCTRSDVGSTVMEVLKYNRKFRDVHIIACFHHFLAEGVVYHNRFHGILMA